MKRARNFHTEFYILFSVELDNSTSDEKGHLIRRRVSLDDTHSLVSTSPLPTMSRLARL